MNLRARSTFRAGDWSRLEALLVPKLTAGAQAAADIVLAASQEIVPVDTGYLKSTGVTEVEWKGSAVTGYVSYGADYSAYVEFGVGRRGAAGEWAGPYSYGDRAGFAGFGYLRSSLDSSRQGVLDAFRASL